MSAGGPLASTRSGSLADAPPMTRNPMLVRIGDGIPAKGTAHGHAIVRL
jgi:hypothetical protein